MAEALSDGHRRIQRFRVAIPQADLDDLDDRLARTRWSDELPGAAWEHGVPRGYLRELAEYWRGDYNWRIHEANLNELDQFTTDIDGGNVHFVHVRSPEPNALPLLLTHGWPGSIVEFTRIIGPLTDPLAHGGDSADAFHVVALSIPGFGFSGPTRQTGWNLRRIARAFATLMSRLGYERYGAHGGDFGAMLSPELGRIEPTRVVGVHVNGSFAPPPKDPAELDGLSETDTERLKAFTQFQRTQRGYAWIQATKPQTLAYGLTDSPIGQLAWIVEKFKEWTDSRNVPEDAVDREHLLTNVSVYWFTRTAGSSGLLFKETSPDVARLGEPYATPTGVAVFPREVSLSVRRLAERTSSIVHWSEFDRGGHFPATEVPDLLVADLRAFFRALR